MSLCSLVSMWLLFLRMEKSKLKISLAGYTENLTLHLNLTLCLS